MIRSNRPINGKYKCIYIRIPIISFDAPWYIVANISLVSFLSGYSWLLKWFSSYAMYHWILSLFKQKTTQFFLKMLSFADTLVCKKNGYFVLFLSIHFLYYIYRIFFFNLFNINQHLAYPCKKIFRNIIETQQIKILLCSNIYIVNFTVMLSGIILTSRTVPVLLY